MLSVSKSGFIASNIGVFYGKEKRAPSMMQKKQNQILYENRKKKYTKKIQ